ncbi:beta/alpha barrel domain-containing protein [Propionispora hippei]|uniref:Ribulose-phosphate 3-epimerase n=1 Tax=Propionispora hippei DSM 15287 TaxID=1123003 RepID=A0A1M6EL98_9FIRM|nr:hypothetical protein [Propionispora hippei]SHI86176.1 hypothetical protein SAMN02745170_01228 [Propionispora hippei DSM 15287]
MWRFYSPAVLPATAEYMAADRVVRLNPALITLLDGRIDAVPVTVLQQEVTEQVRHLFSRRKVMTFHCDINFPDYGGFGEPAPCSNQAVFTPDFLAGLAADIRCQGGYLNLHMLTDRPLERWREYQGVSPAAVCYQLDAVPDPVYHRQLLDSINEQGSCASPVIEIFGSDSRPARAPADTFSQVQPFLRELPMLTFQAEATAARSSFAAGGLASFAVKEYIAYYQERYNGAIQLQGGVKPGTIRDAAALGADFLVCGTAIFRSGTNSPAEMVDRLLWELAAEK